MKNLAYERRRFSVKISFNFIELGEQVVVRIWDLNLIMIHIKSPPLTQHCLLSCDPRPRRSSSPRRYLLS